LEILESLKMPSLQDLKNLLPDLNFNEQKELRTLFFMSVLRDFTTKFSLFFLPIFLYNLGNSTQLFEFLPLSNLQKGIWALAGYFTIFGFVGFMTGVFSAKFLQKTSYSQAMFVSLLIQGVQYGILFGLQLYPFWWVWLLAAAIDGFQSPMYWQSLQSLLSKHSRRAKMGKRLGSLQLLSQLVTVVGPAVSGGIALWLGLHSLFLIGLVCSLISGILALSIERTEKWDKVSFGEFFSWLKERQFRILTLSTIGKSINDDVIFVWPLYLFLLLGSVESVGYLYTVSLFLALLVTMLVGTYIDKYQSKKPFYASGGVLAGIWLFKTQTLGVWGIAIADAVDRLASSVHTLFFDSFYMKRGKGSNALSLFTYRKMIVNASMVSFWLVFGMLFMIFPNWQSLFVLAGVGVMVSLLVKESRDTSD
jgi:MFS family permease